MRGVVLVLLAAAGCGRLGFDASDDPLVSGDGGGAVDAVSGVDARIDGMLLGHDEDGDGLDDGIDPCPHLPEVTADGDGDGVGDVCDPNPGTGGDAIAVFATMQPTNVPFTLGGAWTQEADAIAVDGTSFAFIDYVGALGNARLVAGMDVLGPVGGGFHQIAFGGDPYFVEVQDTDGVGVAQIVYEDPPGTFTIKRQAPLASGVHAGDLRLDVTYRVATEVRTDLGWPGETYQLQYDTADVVPMTTFRLGQNAVAMRVRYVLIITSP